MNGLDLLSVGQVTVVTSNDGGHPPEHYAERIVDRLISVSETASPHIRAQALAYQDKVRGVVLAGVRGAVHSNQTTIVARLKTAGMPEAAALVTLLQGR